MNGLIIVLCIMGVVLVVWGALIIGEIWYSVKDEWDD